MNDVLSVVSELVSHTVRDAGGVTDFPRRGLARAVPGRRRGVPQPGQDHGAGGGRSDEGQGAAAGERSTAALLPRRPSAQMRIVVPGQPRPPVPDDVAPDHLLRRPKIIHPLAPYPDAWGISALARRELYRLLKDERVGVRLLGLLVGTGRDDLPRFGRIRRVLPYEVNEMLRGITGRSFLPASPGPLPDMPGGPSPMRSA